MKSIATALIILALSFLVVNTVSAYGYGTSSITLASSSVSLSPGNGTSVGYTVSLASGSTWGTTLSVVNSGQLATDGIKVSLSNTYADPTYSGTMTIGTSGSTPQGKYTILLAATGDDPSTSNATFELTVLAKPLPTTAQTTTTNTTVHNTTTVQGTTTQQTTMPSTTTKNYTTSAYYSPAGGTAALASPALIVIIALAAIYGIYTYKSRLARLTIIGAALILIGTVAWLYGDYSGGIQTYIWGGAAAVAIGTAAWTYGDAGGGTFKQKSSSGAVYLGIAIIAVGFLAWIYGELGAPGVSSYWWGGTALLVIGTLVWLYGDAKAGAFLRRTR
ncbi:MAG: hypothetical protein M1286_02365 [Candidatus Marsarchaeota archaeon]|nr:hypothetical protein [Candidatus Marsarchaeota archaeon]